MTYQSLLAAILSDPASNRARYRLADWLDRHGETDRAAFIHLQIRLARIKTPPQDMLEQEQELLRIGGKSWGLPCSGRVRHTFRRGFVNAVYCTCAEWTELGRAIVRNQPIEHVQLLDKAPEPMGDGVWFRLPAEVTEDGPGVLPQGLLYDFRCGRMVANGFCFPSAESAQEALSEACVVWARNATSSAIS